MSVASLDQVNSALQSKIEKLYKLTDKKGYESDEVNKLLTDILEEASDKNDFGVVVCALRNKWIFHVMRGQWEKSSQLLRKFKRIIENKNNPLLWSGYYHMKGSMLLYLEQDLPNAIVEIQKAVSLSQKALLEKCDETDFGLHVLMGLNSYLNLATACVMSGRVDQAIQSAKQYLNILRSNDLPSGERSIPIAVTHLAKVHNFIGLHDEALKFYDDAKEIPNSYTVNYIVSAQRIWAKLYSRKEEDLLSQIHNVITAANKNQTSVLVTMFEMIHLLILLEKKQYDAVRRRAEDVIKYAEKTDDRLCLSEIYRLRAKASEYLNIEQGEILSDLEAAVEIATQQGATLLLLKAANQRRVFEMKNGLSDRTTHIIEYCLGRIASTTMIDDVDEGENLLLQRIAAA